MTTVAATMDGWQWVGGADNVTATLVALAAITVTVRAALRRSVFRRRVFRQALDSLAIGVNEEFVAALLGPPAFGRLDQAGCGTLVWVSPHGYVHACFEDGAVGQFAVTVTDPGLRYDISRMTMGVLRGRLGSRVETTGRLEGVYAWLGARRYGCVLSYYSGNPGGYLHHSLAYNDASGVGRLPKALIACTAGSFADGRLYANSQDRVPDQELAAQLEAQLVANTVIVTRDDRLLISRVLGVDADDMRLLQRKVTWAESVNRWRWRRRWRSSRR